MGVLTNRHPVICALCGRRLEAGNALIGERNGAPAVVCANRALCAGRARQQGKIATAMLEMSSIDPELGAMLRRHEAERADALARVLEASLPHEKVKRIPFWTTSGPAVVLEPEPRWSAVDALGRATQYLDAKIFDEVVAVAQVTITPGGEQHYLWLPEGKVEWVLDRFLTTYGQEI